MVASPDQKSATAADRVGEVDRVTDRSPAGWDDLTVNAPGGHVMQGTAWAEHRRSQGARPQFVIFEDGSGALVTLRSSPFVPGTVASMRRGPAHGGLGSAGAAARCAAVARWARNEGVRELVVDPELAASAEYERLMDQAGFEVAPEVQPSIHVMRLDFPPNADEASVLAAFSKSTRQRIRAAEKSCVHVRDDVAGDGLDVFADLLVERAEALDIELDPSRGYLAAWRRLIAAGQARLLVADHDGTMLGGLLLYRQGGSHSTAFSADRASERRRFPGTMHLVRWTAIRDAMADGAPAIELGGVDMPGRRGIPAKGDPNYGLYEHKASFGAEWVVRTQARRIVLRPWLERYVVGRRRLLAGVRRLASPRA